MDRNAARKATKAVLLGALALGIIVRLCLWADRGHAVVAFILSAVTLSVVWYVVYFISRIMED